MALGTFFLLIGSLFALGARDNSILGITVPGSGAVIRPGVKGLIVPLISLVLMVAIVVCAMKLKEGMQWARMALSAIACPEHRPAVLWRQAGGLLGIVAAVLMWLPESTAWLNSRAKGVTSYR